MPRQARLDAPGVLHHVMVRGIERGVVFRDNADREDFVRRLSQAAESGKVAVYAWALLPNHIHLLVRSGTAPLSRVMRSLLTGYAGRFNRRHRRSGHLFQNRYKSIACEEEPYFRELVRYLHLNPLRAGVVKDMGQLDRYPYTGHSALMGRVGRRWQDTGEVLGRFGGRVGRAREGYRRFVQDGIPQGRRPDLMGGGLIRSMGGWKVVSEIRRGREAYSADERVLGSSRFVEGLLKEAEEIAVRPKVDLATLGRRIARHMGLTWEALSGRGRSREQSRARSILAYVWVKHLGGSGRELSLALCMSPQAVSLAARRAEEEGTPARSDLERWCRA